MKYFFSLSFFLISSSLVASPTRYNVDPSHTNVNFDIDHLGFSTVTGQFKDFSGSFELDPKTGALTNLTGSVKAKSIDTNNEDRDDHLRGKDFFHAGEFAELRLQSTKLNLMPGKKGKMTADLTIKGVTKPTTFDVFYRGMGADPFGNQKAGLEATAKINREDFGLVWNKVLETGGVLVGKNVQIAINIEGTKVMTEPEVNPVADKATKKK